MALTAKQLDSVEDAFRSVHERFVYQTETLRWGEVEHWETSLELPEAPAKIYGDCDAHALACRRELRRRDLRNRLVFCRTESGGFHLVCECEGWILDNRHDWVMSRNDLDYQWISISGYETGDPWRKIVG